MSDTLEDLADHFDLLADEGFFDEDYDCTLAVCSIVPFFMSIVSDSKKISEIYVQYILSKMPKFTIKQTKNNTNQHTNISQYFRTSTRHRSLPKTGFNFQWSNTNSSTIIRLFFANQSFFKFFPVDLFK